VLRLGAGSPPGGDVIGILDAWVKNDVGEGPIPFAKMIAKLVLSAAAILLIPTAMWADQVPLEDLVKMEQANLDNEAVSIYGGSVGGVEAIFFIEWSGTGSPVEGRYYFPVRGKNKMYILKGTNPKTGVLVLEEFTADGEGTLILNANCKLKKRVSDGRIVWAGEKTYENGLQVSMSFSRAK